MNSKHPVSTLLLLAAVMWASWIPDASADTPLGTAFTYQGRLLSGANPANGNYDLTFSLYDGPDITAERISDVITHTPVTVTNGVFTTSLDFGAVFQGKARWLAIGARTVGAPAYTTLPRQLLTPSPHTLFAAKAGGLVGDSFSTPIGLNDHNIHFRGVDDTNHGLGYFGWERPFAGLAVDGPVLYGFAGGALGTNQNGEQNAALTWDATGNVMVLGAVTAQAFKGSDTTKVTVKDQATVLKLDAASHVVVGHALGLFRPQAWQTFTAGESGNLQSLTIHYATWREENIASGSIQYRLSIRDGDPGAGSPQNLPLIAGEQALSAVAYPGEKRTFNFSGATLIAGKKYTIYIHNEPNILSEAISSLSALEVGLAATGYGGGKSNFPSELDWYFETIVSNVDRPLLNISSELNVKGEATVNALNILGGSDIAEPFDISTTGTALKPGMVVSIDPDQPGALRLSTGACDRTVAGIISGAGGVNTGLTLTQHGTAASGKHPVALTGRVYCYVDAGADGPVQPGDLLTTSGTPGHAMKVTDPAKAQGAIIGKAMTPLARGTGLVLVLVSLQ